MFSFPSIFYRDVTEMGATAATELPFENTGVLLRPVSAATGLQNSDPQTQSAIHPELKQTPDSQQGPVN